MRGVRHVAFSSSYRDRESNLCMSILVLVEHSEVSINKDRLAEIDCKAATLYDRIKTFTELPAASSLTHELGNWPFYSNYFDVFMEVTNISTGAGFVAYTARGTPKWDI